MVNSLFTREVFFLFIFFMTTFFNKNVEAEVN